MKNLVFVAVAVLCASSSSAGEPWAAVAGGYSSYNLGEITDSGTTYRGYNLENGSLEGGPCFALSVGVDFEAPWSFGFAYKRTSGSTRGQSDIATLSADIPFNEIKVVPSFYFLNSSSLRLGLGAGVGVGFVDGNATIALNSGSNIEGSVSSVGILVEGMVSAEYRVLGSLSIQLTGGYRYTKFDEFEVGGAPIERDDTGEVVEFDFSGLSAQAGVKWLFPSSSVGI